MKPTVLFFPLLLMLLLSACHPEGPGPGTVNPVIGDASFITKFGYLPGETTSEKLRIETHLEYVENILRRKNVMAMPEALRERRKHLLDLLHEYRMAGIFPRNYDHPGRVPCFIDRDGRICAVGYLVEKTAGREAAEEINRLHQYDDLLAMNSPLLDEWITGSGLTRTECAMIQPTYGMYPANYNYVSPAYGTASAVLGGLNLSLSTMNGIQIGKGSSDLIIPITGLVTGAGQITLGAAMFPEDQNGPYGNITNEAQKTVSFINIGLGTSTVLLSAWNLIDNHKVKRPTSWSVYGFPTGDNQAVAGFYLSHRF